MCRLEGFGIGPLFKGYPVICSGIERFIFAVGLAEAIDAAGITSSYQGRFCEAAKCTITDWSVKDRLPIA